MAYFLNDINDINDTDKQLLINFFDIIETKMKLPNIDHEQHPILKSLINDVKNEVIIKLHLEDTQTYKKYSYYIFRYLKFEKTKQIQEAIINNFDDDPENLTNAQFLKMYFHYQELQKVEQYIIYDIKISDIIKEYSYGGTLYSEVFKITPSYLHLKPLTPVILKKDTFNQMDETTIFYINLKKRTYKDNIRKIFIRKPNLRNKAECVSRVKPDTKYIIDENNHYYD